MPLSTVSGILTRVGMGKLGRLGLEPAVRYERSRPGDLLHIDVKKLGRIVGGAGHRFAGPQHHTPRFTDRDGHRRGTAGWEFVHVCVDDATRLAYVEVLQDEKATTAVGFLRRAVAFYASHGITAQQLLTDKRWRLHLCRTCSSVPDARDQASADQAPQTPNQRQGRALYPHDARRLGLWSDPPQQHRAHPSPIRLARAIQLATTTRRPQPQAARNSPTRTEQPPRVLQLDASRGRPSAPPLLGMRR